MTWPLRRRFWNWLAVTKYRAHKPDAITEPRPEPRLRRVPMNWKYPAIPVRKISVSDSVPRDESFVAERLFGRTQAALFGLFSPMSPRAPAIAADPEAALDDVYTAAHRRCYPRPVRPRGFDREIDLGALAVASPYACYLKSDGQGGFRWDFGGLERFECHAGLRSPAAIVEFSVDRSGALRAERIQSDAGDARPGDRDWGLGQRLALCAAANHLSLVRHFTWVHLAAGTAMALATRNELPVRHPVRRLIWPHVYGTQYSNELITIGNLTRGGEFDSVFSFTRAGTLALIEATFAEFELAAVNPTLDALSRGILNAGFATPALDNRAAIYDVMERHCRRYLDVYYPSDDALASDAAFLAWFEALDRETPHGARAVAGAGVTLDGAARLLATLIYLAAVEHEIVGTGVWDYQSWPDVQPVRVARDGSRLRLDVYQRLVNENFTLNVKRTPLMLDFSWLALDERGAEAFRRFREELLALQTQLDREPAQSWRMEPKNLKANINA